MLALPRQFPVTLLLTLVVMTSWSISTHAQDTPGAEARWLITEYDGTVTGLLEFEGAAASWSENNAEGFSNPREDIDMTGSLHPLYRFAWQDSYGDRLWLLLMVTDDFGVVWRHHDNDLTYARRLQPPPAQLQTEWTISELGGYELGNARWDGDELRVDVGADPDSGPAEVTGSPDTQMHVVHDDPTQTGLLHYHLRALSDAAYLAHIHDDDRFGIVHRPELGSTQWSDLSGEVTLQAPGRWVVMGVDGVVQASIDIEETLAIWTQLYPSEARGSQLYHAIGSDSAHPYYHLVAADQAPGIDRHFWMVRDDWAVVWDEGSQIATYARRLQSIPADFQGTWISRNPSNVTELGTIPPDGVMGDITAETCGQDDLGFCWVTHPTVMDTMSTIDFHQAIRIDDDFLIMHGTNGQDFVFFYREGMAPGWMDELYGPPTQ